MSPVGIQRKRTKGFKLESPNGLPIVYVGRGSKWGNRWFLEDGLVKYKAANGQVWLEGAGDINTVLTIYEDWLIRQVKKGLLDIEALRGKNPACWCPLTRSDGSPYPCHRNILLNLANQKEPGHD
jgi:hypothetical protein